MPELLVVIFLSCALLFAVYLLRQNKNIASAQREGPPEGDLDGDAGVRHLIASSDEVQGLYEKLGCSPQEAWKIEDLLRDLKGLIRAEVPDYPALLRALGEVQKQVERAEDGDAGQAMLGAWYRSEGGDLLREALTARGDRDSFLALLNRDPVGEPLPFIEQAPFFRDGQLIWRTPVEVTLIRKRPTDAARFAQLLEDLERTVANSGTPRNEAITGEILGGIARLRRDLLRESAYLPQGMRLVEARLSAWLAPFSDPSAQARKAGLDGVLEGLALLLCWPDPGTLDGPEAAHFREAVQQQAQGYLEAAWMHTPWLTARFLTHLIEAELTLLPLRARRRSRGSAATLRWVRDEVSAGRYDGDENIRRLQQQEEGGRYAHSLVYALLRLHRPPSSMTSQEG